MQSLVRHSSDLAAQAKMINESVEIDAQVILKFPVIILFVLNFRFIQVSLVQVRRCSNAKKIDIKLDFVHT